MSMKIHEILQSVRWYVNELSTKHTVVENVLMEAEKHGWERVITLMDHDTQVKLIRMLVKDNKQTHALLEKVVSIYEHVIDEFANTTEQMLEDMDDEIEIAVACERNRKKTNWLGLLAAGGIGYVIGKKE